MRMSFSTYRKSLLRLAIFLWVGAFCVALIYGCYPNIKWAEETGLIYSTTYVNKENWESCGLAPGVGAFHYGPIYGVHYIIISEDLKEDLYYKDHELKHARFPEWRHP